MSGDVEQSMCAGLLKTSVCVCRDCWGCGVELHVWNYFPVVLQVEELKLPFHHSL